MKKKQAGHSAQGSTAITDGGKNDHESQFKEGGTKKSTDSQLFVKYSTQAFPEHVVSEGSDQKRVALLVSLGQDYYEGEKANALLRHLDFLSAKYHACVDIVVADTLQVHNALDPWQFRVHDTYQSLDQCVKREPIRDWEVVQVGDIEETDDKPGTIYYNYSQNSSEITYKVNFDLYSFIGGEDHNKGDEIYGSYKVYSSAVHVGGGFPKEGIKKGILNDVARKTGSNWFTRNEVSEILGRKQWDDWPHSEQYKAARKKIDELFESDWRFKAYFLHKLSRFKSSRRSKLCIPEHEYMCWKVCHAVLTDYFRDHDINHELMIDAGLFYESMSWKLRSMESVTDELASDVLMLIKSNEVLKLPYFYFIKEYILEETALLMLVWGSKYDYIMYHDQETERLFDYCRQKLVSPDVNIPVWLPVEVAHRSKVKEKFQSEELRNYFSHVMSADSCYVMPTITDVRNNHRFFYLKNNDGMSHFGEEYTAVFYDDYSDQWLYKEPGGKPVSCFGISIDENKSGLLQLNAAKKRGFFVDKDRDLLERVIPAPVSINRTTPKDYMLDDPKTLLNFIDNGHLSRLCVSGDPEKGVKTFLAYALTHSKKPVLLIESARFKSKKARMPDLVLEYLMKSYELSRWEVGRAELYLNEVISQGLLFIISDYDEQDERKKQKIHEFIECISSNPFYDVSCRVLVHANEYKGSKKHFLSLMTFSGYSKDSQVLKIFGVDQTLVSGGEKALQKKHLFYLFMQRISMQFILSNPAYIRDFSEAYDRSKSLSVKTMFETLIKRDISRLIELKAIPALTLEVFDEAVKEPSFQNNLARFLLDVSAIKDATNENIKHGLKIIQGKFNKKLLSYGKEVIEFIAEHLKVVMQKIIKSLFSRKNVSLSHGMLSENILVKSRFFLMDNDGSFILVPSFVPYFIASLVHDKLIPFEEVSEVLPFGSENLTLWMLLFDVLSSTMQKEGATQLLNASLSCDLSQDDIIALLHLYDYITKMLPNNVSVKEFSNVFSEILVGYGDDSIQSWVSYCIDHFLQYSLAIFVNQMSVDLNQELISDSQTQTLFFQGVRSGNTELVCSLLALKAEINRKASYGYGESTVKDVTPLMVASENPSLDMVTLLIDKKADIQIRDENGVSALMRAIRSGHLCVLKNLYFNDDLSYDSSGEGHLDCHDNSLLHYACTQDSIDVIKWVLKFCINIYTPFIRNNVLQHAPFNENEDGMSPILLAIKNDNLPVFVHFFERDLLNPYDAFNGLAKIFSFLPDGGSAGRLSNAIHYFKYACGFGAIRVLTFIMGFVRRFPSKVLTQFKKHAVGSVSLAVSGNHVKVLKHLLQNDEFINSQDELFGHVPGKQSALSQALANSNLSSVRLLLTYASKSIYCSKSDIKKTLIGGITSPPSNPSVSGFVFLYRMGDLGLVQRSFSLLSNPADCMRACHLKDSDSGNTLLLMAAQRGHFMLLKYTIGVFKKALDNSKVPQAKYRKFKKRQNKTKLSKPDKMKVSSIWRKEKLKGFFNQKNSDDNTALRLASKQRYRSIVSLLVDEVRALDDVEVLSETANSKL